MESKKRRKKRSHIERCSVCKTTEGEITKSGDDYFCGDCIKNQDGEPTTEVKSKKKHGKRHGQRKKSAEITIDKPAHDSKSKRSRSKKKRRKRRSEGKSTSEIEISDTEKGDRLGTPNQRFSDGDSSDFQIIEESDNDSTFETEQDLNESITKSSFENKKETEIKSIEENKKETEIKSVEENKKETEIKSIEENKKETEIKAKFVEIKAKPVGKNKKEEIKSKPVEDKTETESIGKQEKPKEQSSSAADKEKDAEIARLKQKITDMETTFFKNNKYLKSPENVGNCLKNLIVANADLLNKVETVKENQQALINLHYEAVHELRKIIHEKNQRLEKFSENYPDISESIVTGGAAETSSEIAQLEDSLAEARAEATSWIDKYNEMMQINDNLRRKFEQISTEVEDDSKKESNKSDDETIEGSDYDSQYEDYNTDEEREKPAEKTGDDGEQASGWFGGWI